MTTATKLGPADHGRAMTYPEYLRGDYQEGFHYELIDGRLYVSPQANLPEGFVEKWLYRLLDRYSEVHPEVINYVHPKARVFVKSRPEDTNPEPDIAAYHDFPLNTPVREMSWEDVSPVLVVEVISKDDPDKDFERNRDLYLEVPSIREYWVIDARKDPEKPALRVHTRRGKRWVVRNLPGGATYAPRLLPGFELTLRLR